jgi:hypothetical protein
MAKKAKKDSPRDDDGIDLNKRMRPQDKFTPRQVIEALERSAGIRSAAARQLRCSPSTITYYIDKCPQIAEACEEIREGIIDMAEGQLVSAVQNGNLTAVIFTLKTIGRERGYSERVEQRHLGLEDMIDAAAREFDSRLAGYVEARRAAEATEGFEP